MPRTAKLKTPEEYFKSFVEKIEMDESTGCWNWRGAFSSCKRYGVFLLCNEKRQARSHRISHEIFLGKIRKGLVVDHICRNTHCVNPDHLRAVSNSFNAANNHRRVFCHNGHDISKPGSYTIAKKMRGGRTCNICGTGLHLGGASIHIRVDEDMMDNILAFKEANHCTSIAHAVNLLIRKGLENI